MKKKLIFEIFNFFHEILWIFFKREFFSIKNFQKSFFFKIVELFIYLIFFHETEVWCQVLLKVLFFEKIITKFQTWKKHFFLIFSKGFTAEKILIRFSFLSKFQKKIFRVDFLDLFRSIYGTYDDIEHIQDVFLG